MRLVLPTYINADGLLPFVAQLGNVGSARIIEIDFTHLRRVSPAALVALTAQVSAWQRRGSLVVPIGLPACAILGYLQRMDLLKSCGFSLPETFTRHEAKGRFVPVRPINHQVQEMGSEMALCVAPGGDDWEHPLAGPYDFVWYVLTEMSNNVRQHSGGCGFASAQVTQPSEGLVRLAIADNGRGILESFREAGLPWSTHMDDTGAILKALEPRISSKGSPSNEGVGLTLTSKMAELAGAWLLIISGRGVVRLTPGAEPRIQPGILPDEARYPGTLVALNFRQDRAHNFALLLDAAKRESGLLQQRSNRGRFQT